MVQQMTTNSPRISTEVVRKAVACNFCGNETVHAYCPQNGRGLVQCEACGLVYVGMQPDPQELYALYGETYFRNDESGEVGYTDYLKDEGNIRRTFHRRFDHIDQFVSAPGTMLDVGCALGFNMDVAAERGWQVHGLDVSGYAVDYVRDRFGYETHHDGLLDADLPQQAFDLVTMYDVIEHVPDPMGYLERVHEVLRPGGIFEVATPDVGSFPARLTGKRWIGYKLSDEHVYYFSVHSLSSMLQAAGFDVLHVRHIGKYVTMRLFLDRLGFYAPWLSSALAILERRFHLSEQAFYVNPFDIMSITARKR